MPSALFKSHCIKIELDNVPGRQAQSSVFREFVFVPSATGGDRERDPYVLKARTQAEMDEWVRSIRRVIGARSSGGKIETIT